MKTKNNYITAILLALLFLFVFCTGGGVGNAYAAVTSYSGVLEDLEKDENFKGNEYVRNTSDYGLQVFQIAESTAGELFIYVYQPSSTVVDLRATTVRLSQTTDDNLSPRDYNLTLIDKYNVFYKYKVEDIKVSSAAVRYYDITAIHRKYIDGKDEKPTDDNTINEVVFAVGQLWTVRTVDGEVTYEMKVVDVVEIKPEQKHVGKYRYSNGWGTWDKACDSHYVAFSADRPIETLYEADVAFQSRFYTESLYGNVNFGPWVDEFVRLTDRQYVDEEPTGLFGGGNSRNYCRIESVNTFYENLTASGVLVKDTDRLNLAGMQWVLRFYESNVRADGSGSNHCREVSNVTILRLKFETEGVVYNLGVVDSKRSGSINPENRQPDFFDWLANLLGVPRWVAQLIFAVVILAIISPLLYLFVPFVRPIFAFVGKALWWVISAPFRFIAWVFKKIFKKE